MCFLWGALFNVGLPFSRNREGLASLGMAHFSLSPLFCLLSSPSSTWSLLPIRERTGLYHSFVVSLRRGHRVGVESYPRLQEGWI